MDFLIIYRYTIKPFKSQKWLGAWSSAKHPEDTLSVDRGPFFKSSAIINKTKKVLLFKFNIEVLIVL